MRPFPTLGNTRTRLTSALLFGVFVMAFLGFFKPFGLQSVKGKDVWLVYFSYGAVTTLSMACMFFLPPKLFKRFFAEEHWTVGKEILMTILTLALISAGNVWISARWGFVDAHMGNVLAFAGYTIAIGIFPVGISVLLRQMMLYRRYVRKSQSLGNHRQSSQTAEPQEEKPLLIQNEKGQVELKLKPEQWFYAKNEDNYVDIVYLHKNGWQHFLVRHSLSAISQQLENGNTKLFRCHRSYSINLQHVQKVSGNARGLQVQLHPDLPLIPVARSATKAFENALRTTN